MKKKLKKRKKSVKFFTKKTLKIAAKNSIFKDMAERKKLLSPNPVGNKYSSYTSTLPITIDLSAAREAMADAVGYERGECGTSDNRRFIIEGLLIEEITRLREQNHDLKFTVQNYLEVLSKEKAQNAHGI